MCIITVYHVISMVMQCPAEYNFVEANSLSEVFIRCTTYMAVPVNKCCEMCLVDFYCDAEIICKRWSELTIIHTSKAFGWGGGCRCRG